VCTGDGASDGERGDRGSDPGHGVVGDWRDGVSTGARAAAGEEGGGGVVAERDRGATVERAVVEPIAPGGGSRLSTVGEGISQGGGRDDGGQTIPRGSRQ